MIWHVIPINDVNPHTELSTCECTPRVEEVPNGDLMVIHNAWDGREAIEIFNEIVKND